MFTCFSDMRKVLYPLTKLNLHFNSELERRYALKLSDLKQKVHLKTILFILTRFNRTK